jgi:hypothetical protein
MKRTSALLLALAAATLLSLVVTGMDPLPADARGGEAAPAPQQPDPARGPIYFDQSVSWVNDGKQGIHALTDFYADLADVKFNLGTNNHEGYMRLWLKTPDKYRIEVRPQRPMRQLTTKILSGQQMWVLHPDGRTDRMHGRSEGAAAIQQLQSDRKRLLDLATFLTLNGLKGPSVRFLYEGTTVGSGTFAGNWIKIRRVIPDGAEVEFHLGYERDPRDPTGRTVRTTFPGVVTIKGDPRRNEPTEYYLLKDWKRGPQFRYPARIEAFSQDKPGGPMRRFLLAFPNDIRINTNLDASLFAPPVTGGATK